MRFFDTHAHLDDEQFDDVPAVVTAARAAGVQDIVAVGTTAESSRRCLELASTHAGVHAAVGIQPNYTQQAAGGDWETIQSLASQPAVVAIGETGLDHYWDYADLGTQHAYFRRHIRLSFDVDKPLVIHMRDPRVEPGQPASRACQEDIYQVLSEAAAGRTVSGVMHSFTGDQQMADRFLDLGLYLSFAGMVTYNSAGELRAVAATVPDDRILIETDAPYLSPHPVRGQRPNQPALVVHTASCLAECRAVDLAVFAGQTTENARRLFRVEPH